MLDTHGKRLGALMVVFTATFTFLAILAATYALAASFTGTENHDQITGSTKADVIKGLGGRDDLSGRGGNDVIYGGPEADTLRGGLGDDRLHGGPDNTNKPLKGDEISCGGGYDIVYVEKSEHSVHERAIGCEEVVTEH